MEKRRKVKVDYMVVVAAITAVMVMELFALLMGHNGQLLMFSVAVVAGLGGYVLPSPFKVGGKDDEY